MYSSAVCAGGSTSLHSNFTWTGSSPINHSWCQKTTDTGLPEGKDCITLRSLVLTQYRRVGTAVKTDGHDNSRKTDKDDNVLIAIGCNPTDRVQ